MLPDRPQLTDAEAYDRFKANHAEKDRANASIKDNIQKPTNPMTRRANGKAALGKVEENAREIDSANAINGNTPLSTLERWSKAGLHTEVSGDAVARARKGQTPKLHRS